MFLRTVVCLCVFSAQGLGGLYHCDNPAVHDGEYKEDIDDFPSYTHTHSLTQLLHQSSFKHKLCVSKHVTISLLTCRPVVVCVLKLC